jgi:hypothetical protein
VQFFGNRIGSLTCGLKSTSASLVSACRPPLALSRTRFPSGSGRRKEILQFEPTVFFVVQASNLPATPGAGKMPAPQWSIAPVADNRRQQLEPNREERPPDHKLPVAAGHPAQSVNLHRLLDQSQLPATDHEADQRKRDVSFCRYMPCGFQMIGKARRSGCEGVHRL